MGKMHHLPICRPASCQVGSPDIRPRLATSARPPSQHHLAGSLFATYTGSASCFLQTPRFRKCPCLVGVVLPSGNGGPSCPRLRLERRPVRHARHTSGTTRKAGGMRMPPRGGLFREDGPLGAERLHRFLALGPCGNPTVLFRLAGRAERRLCLSLPSLVLGSSAVADHPSSKPAADPQ